MPRESTNLKLKLYNAVIDAKELAKDWFSNIFDYSNSNWVKIDNAYGEMQQEINDRPTNNTVEGYVKDIKSGTDKITITKGSGVQTDIPIKTTIDSTLSIKGQAADAKITGDKLNEKLDLSGGTITGTLNLANPNNIKDFASIQYSDTGVNFNKPIKADINGVASAANKLNYTVKLTGGDGENRGFRLIGKAHKSSLEGNPHCTMLVNSEQQGNGIVSITMDYTTKTAKIKYWGGESDKPDGYGAPFSIAWQVYFSSQNNTMYLFWAYKSNSPTEVYVISSNFEISNGPWVDTIDTNTYGELKATTEINNATTLNGYKIRWNHNTKATQIPVLSNNIFDYISRSEIDVAASGDDYIRFMNGIQICWSWNASKSSGAIFAVPFLNTNYGIGICGMDAVKYSWYVLSSNRRTTGFTAKHDATGANFYYIVIGLWK